MFSLLKDIWHWATNQALQQLLILVIAAILCFLVLLKYPIEFERTNYEIKQNIQITETTKYIINSTFTDGEAKVKLETHSYYVEVRKENE